MILQVEPFKEKQMRNGDGRLCIDEVYYFLYNYYSVMLDLNFSTPRRSLWNYSMPASMP